MSGELMRLVECSVLVMLMSLACAKDASPPPSEPRGAPNWDGALTHAARYDGARRALVVDVTIGPGFHAYTAGETIGKPLQLDIAADSELAADGPTQYPKGVVKELTVGRSMIVEGRAELVATLRDPAPGKAAKATFRYQVCTDVACDRPRSVEVTARVP
jgi:hypothetical protein